MKLPGWVVRGLAKPLPQPRVFKPGLGPRFAQSFLTPIRAETRKYPVFIEKDPITVKEYTRLYYDMNRLYFVERKRTKKQADRRHAKQVEEEVANARLAA